MLSRFYLLLIFVLSCGPFVIMMCVCLVVLKLVLSGLSLLSNRPLFFMCLLCLMFFLQFSGLRFS